jgi:hypothetical protein
MKNTFNKKTEKEATEYLKKTRNAWETKRVQCILLRCLGSDSQTIGTFVGYVDSHVRLVWKQFKNEGWNRIIGERRGQNRGKASLSLKEESDFLESFKSESKTGKLVLEKSIHKSHCDILGKTVDETTTYRLLHRHGWRKIVPRPNHPKHNAKDVMHFKKAIFPPDYDPYES